MMQGLAVPAYGTEGGDTIHQSIHAFTHSFIRLLVRSIGFARLLGASQYMTKQGHGTQLYSYASLLYQQLGWAWCLILTINHTSVRIGCKDL